MQTSDPLLAAALARKIRGKRMRPDSERDPELVLKFWFGMLDTHGCADDEHTGRWWKKDPAFDQLVRQEFGLLHAAVGGGEHASWLESARGTLATIVVLDQFSRNIFRGAARAFCFDAKALEIASRGIENELDVGLSCDERAFFYMPYMHGEELPAQERSLELYRALRDSLPDGPGRERAKSNLGYAERHHEIVRRFGRFPHRNSLLDRTLTSEEIEFLKQPGSAF